MKKIVVPIAIIVALISVFVIMDRKEFSRHDDVQTVQSESPATNRKPLVSVPETMPVAGEKTADETKPKDTKSPENKSNEIMSETEAESVIETNSAVKSEDKSFPAAVPFLTPEEAVLLTKEQKDPFFRLYENEELETIIFEGTVRAVSTIPDPQKNDYPDCLYVVRLDINSFQSDSPLSKKITKELYVAIPILKDNIVVPSHLLKPGDKIVCHSVLYDDMPQTINEIQLSDDFQSFEDSYYYVFDLTKTNDFSFNGSKAFAKKELIIPSIQSLPKDEEASLLRKKRIQEEISRIEEELKMHGGTFDAWKNEYKAIAEKFKNLQNEKWSGWIGNSYFSAGTDSELSYNTEEFIKGILPYKTYLEEKGIDLIVLRVPHKQDFAARVLASETFQENPAWIEHYYNCLKNDIEIVDPMPEMWKHRFDLPAFYIYWTNQSHPGEGMHFFAAKYLASILERYGYKPETNSFSIRRVKTKGNNADLLYPSGNEKYPSGSNIEYYQVLQGENVLTDLEQNSGSPFLFVSNSFFGKVPYYDETLPKYVTYHLQSAVDWLYQPSKHASLYRILLSDMELLSNRKAVIVIGMKGMWSSIPAMPRYYIDGISKMTLEKTICFDELSIFDNNLYLFKETGEGTQIDYNAQRSFSFNLTLPAVPGMQTCVVRIKFYANSYPRVTAIDSQDGTIIESAIQPGVNFNRYCEFYIPVKNEPRVITFKFEYIAGESNTTYFDKCELWYY